MDGRDFEQMLERIMKVDFSAGTEAFRDALLARCLEVLCEDGIACISDDDLEMVAAAGNAGAQLPYPFESDGFLGDNVSASRLI